MPASAATTSPARSLRAALRRRAVRGARWVLDVAEPSPPEPSPPAPDRLALAEDRYRQHPGRHQRIWEQIAAGIADLEPRPDGPLRALEIGGRNNPFGARLQDLGWDYAELDLAERPGVVIGDITNCPQVPSASFDLVLSVDVFEHIDRPWLAATEITRLLRPGGLSYTSTLFSWRYHPCPIDFWRFSAPCLTFLFDGLRTIDAGYDTVERRRDMRSKPGAVELELDDLGGWRENWRVYHLGTKVKDSPPG